MNILMVTNTYTPIVGGLERSIKLYSRELRRQNHRVLIVAPEFKNMPRRENHVIRFPAIQEFNGTDFSVSLPVPGVLTEAMKRFKPDLIHTHHPFLMGDTAMRLARINQLPLVLTYHTVYEKYSHYVPGSSPKIKKFIIELTKGYAGLCDMVIVPSIGIKKILMQRKVKAPLTVLPTGIQIEKFRSGDRIGFRDAMTIPRQARLFGTVGRITKEKNMIFCAECAARFMKKDRKAHFLMVGDGDEKEKVLDLFRRYDVLSRVHAPGTLHDNELVNAYHAMDAFLFASKTETQGIVLNEAMASGTPVIGLSATGVDDVLVDGRNGRLIRQEKEDAFVSALTWLFDLPGHEYQSLVRNARADAEDYSIKKCVRKLIDVYASLKKKKVLVNKGDAAVFEETRQFLKTEWELIKNSARSAEKALFEY
ncbi:MAG: glycosyltransferase [Elusimicrobia bacterium]|nr:glycosyltransferase [Elusimicrobiota bacterium]MBD3412309.1 glycosyltransferase [Elusimicrobiota bacterium]